MLQKNFSVNTIKIDRSFIDDVEFASSSQAIIKSIMTLAQQLQMSTVGEGVENEKQFDLLVTEKCEQTQGFYFSRPVSADNVKAFIKHSHGILAYS